MPILTLPHSRFRESFLEALKEYHAEHLHTYENIDEEWMRLHFEDYLAHMAAEARGEELPPGYVKHTVFWLTEGDTYLGRLDLRHELNEFLLNEAGHIGYDIRPSHRGKGLGKLILELGLAKAKELGLKTVLLTCDVTNLPSNKIIQSQGAELEDTRVMGPGKPDKNRYWIKI